MSLLRAMMAGVYGPPGYDTVMATLAPDLWWKLEETSGTVAADASGNGYDGVVDFTAFPARSVAAAPGYAGLKKGLRFGTVAGPVASANIPLALGAVGGAAGTWAISFWALPENGTSQMYAVHRGNTMAVLYGYTPSTFELYSTVFTGSNPRPGSQLVGQPGQINHVVYRYVNGQYAGFINGVKQFQVARSFALGTDVPVQWVASLTGPNAFRGTIYDLALFLNNAPSDAEVAALYAARNYG